MQSGVQPSAHAAYAGDVTPKHAWEQVKNDAASVLVDVRTPEEWQLIGYPDLSSIGKQTQKISWRIASGLNGNFAAEFETLGLAKDTPVFFLCRSGGRSAEAAAAMTRQGYTRCYNIDGGCEGGLPEGYLAQRPAGWIVSGLPLVKGA